MNALRSSGIRFMVKEVTDKPVSVKLLDQPLVIWRANGNLSAFYDLCLHRARRFRWLVSGDSLVCISWLELRRGRRCTRIPSLPPDREIPAKARTRRIACKSVMAWSGCVSTSHDRTFRSFPLNLRSKL